MTARDEIVYEAHHEIPPDDGWIKDPNSVDARMREDAGYFLACTSPADVDDLFVRLFAAMEADNASVNAGSHPYAVLRCLNEAVTGQARLVAERNR